jgi:uncharacterized protein YdeI (YjbR/CyaY-like superfamily)
MKKVYAKDRAAWRSWLKKNADTANDVWLVYYKKNSGRASVEFSDALDEALCFGWVDTKVKSLDALRYMMRFAVRKPTSSWSPSNIERVKHLIKERRMSARGLAAFEGHQKRRTAALPTELPKALARDFRSHRIAWANFSAFPPGYRRVTIGWVASAKLPATRERRLVKVIEASARNQRLPFI